MRLIGATTDRNDPNVLVWETPTTVMNPSITEEFIQAEMERDQKLDSTLGAAPTDDRSGMGCALLYRFGWVAG